MSDCYWGVHWYGLQIACKMARHLRLHSQYWNFFAVIACHCFPQSCVQIYIWQLWRPCHTQANDLRRGYVLSWSLFSVWCSCRQICINNNISKAMSDTNLSLSLFPGWVMSWILFGVFGCSCVQIYRNCHTQANWPMLWTSYVLEPIWWIIFQSTGSLLKLCFEC